MVKKLKISDAWKQVLDSLSIAGEKICEVTENHPNAQAEGYRFLNRVFAAMREFTLEQDPDNPNFAPVMTPTQKFFADNPDTLYHRASIRADHSYRIIGARGSCEYLSFCVYAVASNGIKIVSDLNDRDLLLDKDGRFEITLSSEKIETTGKNWLQLAAGARTLIVRQYYLNRSIEAPATYKIERLGNVQQSSMPTPAEFVNRLIQLKKSIDHTITVTLSAAKIWMQHPNQISIDSSAGGVVDLFPTPDNQYVGGWFCLRENEALVLEVVPPDCRYWSVHLMSRWLESFDAHRHTISINKSQAIRDGDGVARFVIAARDPKISNWLDTGGRAEGFFVFRWLQAKKTPALPKCFVVGIDSNSFQSKVF